MSKKIRILQSVGTLGIGGNEIFVMNFFRNIDKEKFEVDFVIYDDSKMDFYEEIISSGSKIYICKTNIKNKYLDTLFKIIKVKRILTKNKYDIIHCHSCSFIGIFRGAIAGTLTKGIKVISHSHNPGMPKNNLIDNFIRKIFKKYLSKIVDIGFACSDIAAESKYTNQLIESNKFAIINNAIDINKFLYNIDVRKNMRSKYNINNEFIIGTIGRLEEQKNHKFLLKVFSEIRKQKSSVKLIIVGEGSLHNELKNYAIDNGFEKDVIFVGKVSESNIYYQMMDVFVLTSLYEGFPFVMVEAQANGLPIVISSIITKSVDISGNVKFVSLENSEKEWADIILNSSNTRCTIEDCKDNCKEYNLEYQSKLLEKYYIDLLS